MHHHFCDEKSIGTSNETIEVCLKGCVTMRKKSEYKDGLLSGLPIGIGYFPVSFTFGIMAVNGGMKPFFAIIMSLTNLTSAGQFAGTNLIFSGASYLTIAAAMFVINIRYMLMSVSLSQKLAPKTGLLSRLIFGFGITDEAFAVASVRLEPLTTRYMLGLMTLPIVGWTLGTAAGALLSGILPPALQSAMGVALYAMFIAIIIPPAKKEKPILFGILIAVAVSCALNYIPIFGSISSSLKPLISAIIAALIMAVSAPIEVKEETI